MRVPTMAHVGGLLLLAGMGAAPASSQTGLEFRIDPEAPGSVAFTSTAQIEVVTGATTSIDGFAWVVGPVEPGTPGDGSRLHFEVDLASIRTGISLRDRHMRDNYLETDEYPWAVLDAAIGSIEAQAEGLVVSADGTFSVHGVQQPMSVRCPVAPIGAGFDVRCTFAVELADHGIRIPRVMFMKLAETVTVEVRFRLAPVGQGDPNPEVRTP